MDRTYTAEGRLTDRRQPDALISDAEFAARRAVRAAQEGMAESFCTHGDSPGAVAMAQAVRAALEGAGVPIRPFVESTMTRRLLAYGAARRPAGVRRPGRDASLRPAIEQQFDR